MTHVCNYVTPLLHAASGTPWSGGGWDAVSRNDCWHDLVRPASHPEIRDVIVSGGDPLTLIASQAAASLKFFDGLAAILQRRQPITAYHRAKPVTLPQKLFDQDLIDLLASAEKVWIQTHFNHPREITPKAWLASAWHLASGRWGMPGQQPHGPAEGGSQRLRGDHAGPDAGTAACITACWPYYIFHLVTRSSVPVTSAPRSGRAWRSWRQGCAATMSGLGIPTYVVDRPQHGGGGRFRSCRTILVWRRADDAVVLQATISEGMLVRYQAVRTNANTVAADAGLRAYGVSARCCRVQRAAIDSRSVFNNEPHGPTPAQRDRRETVECRKTNEERHCCSTVTATAAATATATHKCVPEEEMVLPFACVSQCSCGS